MALTLGATHIVSVPTVFTIAQPLGLSVHLANVPAFVPRDIGSPSEYHGVCRLNLGNNLGYQQHIQVVTSPQLIYPLPAELTLCSVNQHTGVTVTVDEIVRPAAAAAVSDPWDRSPAPFNLGSEFFLPAPSGQRTLFTYTVPAGRLAAITSIKPMLSRNGNAAGTGAAHTWVSINGAHVEGLYAQDTVVQAVWQTDMAGGPLIVPAGTVIQGFDVNTSGTVTYTTHTEVLGYLFNT